ncbi:hypothetical protein [Effusibacillus lacus]|nr:hypothetical protein [Effusibacillus lacus]TCS76321.1 hypothetical protein EDD64_10387 [Effusibacillus lacus]
MGVLAFIAGLVFVATLLVLLATFKQLGNQQSISDAQEEARKDTYSGPMV